jgi:SAM-dependent methyltransferase
MPDGQQVVFKMNLKETYNKIAEDWSRDHKKDDWWRKGTDKLMSLLQPSATILDVGCGDGVKSHYLSQNGFKVTGIDFSEKLIEIAKREAPSATFQVMDMKKADSLEEKFDGVIARASLLHIPRNEAGEMISKLTSVLKDGGYLYVAVKGVDESGKEEDILKENDYGYEYERFFSYYRMDELKNYFTKLNLEIVYQDTERVGKTDWLQIIGRKS